MAKSKLPKRILGAKVPKRLRKSAFGDALASKLGQELAKDAIVGVVGLLLTQAANEDSPLRRFLRDRGPEAERLRRALAEAAQAFFRTLRHGAPAAAH